MLRSARLFLCVVLLVAVIGPAAAADPGPVNSATTTTYLPHIASFLPPIIPETTQVLTDDSLAHLQSVSADGVTFTFDAATADLAALDPGDVMVGGVSPATPYGFLRSVVSVVDDNGQVVVQTDAATLENAIEQGEFAATHELSPADLLGVALPPGITLSAVPEVSKRFHFNIDNAVLYDDDGNTATTDDQIFADGALDLLLSLDFSFRLQNWRLKTLQFSGRVDETADLRVGADIAVDSLHKEYPITPPVTLSAVTFFVGPVPVVITPVLRVFVGLDGSAHVGVTASVTQQATLMAGLRYADGNWSPISEFGNSFTYEPPHAYATLNLRAFGGARLAVLLYGVTGPYTTVNLYLALRVDLGAGAWLDLYGGLEVLVGVRLEVFSVRIGDFNRAVIDFEKHLLRNLLGPPPPPPPADVAQANGLAVNPDTGRVYVTSRSANRVYALDGTSLAILGSAPVGALPWGVAVNPTSGKLYVANFGSDTVTVLNAADLALIKTISIGAQPTFVRANAAANRVYVVSYGTDALYVINGQTDTVEVVASTGGAGAWGLTYNPLLNRIYVGHRDSRNLSTLDVGNGYALLGAQNRTPCAAPATPFAMDFNRNNAKLYVACGREGGASTAAIYLASTSGLSSLATITTGQGGGNGGGGVVVDTATDKVFVSNSLEDTISVIGGASDAVMTTVPVDDDPFGLAANPNTRAIYVGYRAGNSVGRLTDDLASAAPVAAGLQP